MTATRYTGGAGGSGGSATVTIGPAYGTTVALATLAVVALSVFAFKASTISVTPAVAELKMVAAYSGGLGTIGVAPSVAKGTGTLSYDVGSNAVTQEDIVNTGWTNIANAGGQHDGTNASYAGSLTTATSGTLVLNYADFPNELAAGYPITSVKLSFYTAQAGTSLSNGTLNHRWRKNAGAWTILQTFTGNITNNPVTYDVSASFTTWAALNSLVAGVNCTTAAANNSTATADAVELLIVATF